jgi:hypothetical protein
MESLFQHDVLKIPSEIGSKCAELRASRAAQSCSFLFSVVLYQFAHRSLLLLESRKVESSKRSS